MLKVVEQLILVYVRRSANGFCGKFASSRIWGLIETYNNHFPHNHTERF